MGATIKGDYVKTKRAKGIRNSNTFYFVAGYSV